MGEYASVHAHRGNLLLHLFAVPLFVGGVIVALAWALQGRFYTAALCFLAPAGAMGLQALGHSWEARQPEPFRNPIHMAARIFREQFWVFPRFVLSGGWLAAWRGVHPA